MWHTLSGGSYTCNLVSEYLQLLCCGLSLTITVVGYCSMFIGRNDGSSIRVAIHAHSGPAASTEGAGFILYVLSSEPWMCIYGWSWAIVGGFL